MDISQLEKYKLIPVVVIENVGDTIPLMQSLCDGGLPVAEITFRTDCVKMALSIAVENFPQMIVGAGTVITSSQAQSAIEVGAKFIVSPGFCEDVADLCIEKNVPYFPGCVTPTEIIKAISKGFTTIKFFPSNIYGGLSAIKALSAPFPQIKFIPTGGVDETNLHEFLSSDKVFAVGGSFMMKGDIVQKTKNAMKIACEFAK